MMRWIRRASSGTAPDIPSPEQEIDGGGEVSLLPGVCSGKASGRRRRPGAHGAKCRQAQHSTRAAALMRSEPMCIPDDL